MLPFLKSWTRSPAAHQALQRNSKQQITEFTVSDPDYTAEVVRQSVAVGKHAYVSSSRYAKTRIGQKEACSSLFSRQPCELGNLLDMVYVPHQG